MSRNQENQYYSCNKFGRAFGLGAVKIHVKVRSELDMVFAA